MPELVVVVGGTSGIGLATAQRLVDGGREVVVVGRDGTKLAAALDQLGKNARGHALDARDQTAMTAMFAELGAVDHVVVTVTGPSGMTPFASMPLSHVQDHVDGKLVTHIGVAQAALPVLRKDGSITFVSAISSGGAMPGTAALAAVNASVEAIVPVLAVELRPVRVNAVSPGVIATPWWDFLPADVRAETFEGFASGTPAGRVGQPSDVAHAIGFLIDNSFTTGVVLRVDGGAQLGVVA
ncbi:SDR family oxidoreductase [Actinocrispum wychmicini]|uniref:NAD(P)-dependent dehydrogenase (Short-subunit alcohol dehydrogenase family) n=1 Tax=Actinocrispum wychmicini TaxID=1213861 RepID=A0A4R2IUQ8_9PSEU|nr:SDR family oxidoreductase [Actinocrispum wychmicini]TCO48807.1 NAD(P)-dependent dehydrogenase (short-subunit alcohol dehydrogenase family) [Actinocrispum wychmicini]